MTIEKPFIIEQAPSRKEPFIIEQAPSRKGPWTRSGGGHCFALAKHAYATARAVNMRDPELRPWVRIRHVDGTRAVHLFHGGRYNAVGRISADSSEPQFGWVRK